MILYIGWHPTSAIWGAIIEHKIVNLENAILISRWPVTVFLNGPSTASFSFIFGLFKQTLQFSYNNIMLKNVHTVYSAGIRTHNLLYASLLP